VVNVDGPDATGNAARSSAEERRLREKLGRLTERECEVLALRASGASVREIARSLCIEQRTAKFHLTNIYAKLDVTQRSQGARQLALAAYGRALDGAGT
jgi:DNA-binding NarL/FixJ family response regulator